MLCPNYIATSPKPLLQKDSMSNILDLISPNAKKKFKLINPCIYVTPDVQSFERTKLGYDTQIEVTDFLEARDVSYPLFRAKISNGEKSSNIYLTALKNEDLDLVIVTPSPFFPHPSGRLGENLATWRYQRGPWTDIAFPTKSITKGTRSRNPSTLAEVLNLRVYEENKARFAQLLVSLGMGEDLNLSVLEWLAQIFNEADFEALCKDLQPHQILTIRLFFMKVGRKLLISKTIASGGIHLEYSRFETVVY